jgi:hypothetical protein
MRRGWILAGFYASPLVAIGIYAYRLGGVGNAYFLSVALGLIAFTYGCNELILAARPSFLVRALGRKRLRSLHLSSAFLILAAGGLHGLLKIGAVWGGAEGTRPGGFLAGLAYSLRFGLGFKRLSLQVLLGEACWWLLLLGGLATLLVLSPGFLSRFGPAVRLRASLARRLGPLGRKARDLHRLWALVILAVLVHELLASSTIFSSNPLGAAWLSSYLAVSVGFFAWSIAARRRRSSQPSLPGPSLFRPHADDQTR